ncbi:MAG: AAA family ATPase [Zoogloeaceae bacterium]|nr:AAA family ATPase [Zoogloeaceae bacterium]
MTVYLPHFGLRDPPFRLTPHPEFFFAGARRGATLEALQYAVLHEEGIVKVSGEVGSGKTMLCRVLLDRLPATVDALYIANPTLSPAALLHTVAEELGCPPQPIADARIRPIQDALIARHAAGRRVVALVDEAHAMPKPALEQIRLLSNLETGQHKLLQIVLVGQPELDDLLSATDMRQLKDRITHHFRLDPMNPADTGDYLRFRLHTAGYRGSELFSPAAVRLIARASGGLTRRINVLADKALLAAYCQGGHRIGRRTVSIAIRDAHYTVARNWRSWLVAGVAVAALAGAAWWHLHGPNNATATPPAADPAPAAAGPA